jgi:hypothetical protein
MFVIQSYPKSELALIYFPKSTPHVAANHLRNWIHGCPELHEALQHINLSPRAKYYSAEAVRLIVQYLGEP